MPTDGRLPDPRLASVIRATPRPAGRARSPLAVMESPVAREARLLCLVDPEGSEGLLPTLRRHFAGEPVAVLVERRGPPGGNGARSLRLGHHRAPVALRDAARVLPPELRCVAARVRLVQPMVPLDRAHETADLAALITATLALEPKATAEFWWRVSPRVRARLHMRGGAVDDEQTASNLVGHILDELPTYDATQQSLTDWLDAVTDEYRPASAPLLRAVSPVVRPAA